MHILFICTANQCRSPMAEALAGAVIRARGLRADCRSRGTSALGLPVTDPIRVEMRRRGIDLGERSSRTVELTDLDWAHIVLTMERGHLHRIATLELGAIGKSFTLREAATLFEAMGSRLPTEDDDEVVARLHRHRLPQTILTFNRTDDVADPTGRSRRAHRRTADEIEALVGQVLAGLAAPRGDWAQPTGAIGATRNPRHRPSPSSDRSKPSDS